MRVSDELVEELKSAEVVVLSLPIHNFTIPACLKAWIDQVARAGVTFKDGPNGQEGLLKPVKVYIVTAAADMAVGGPDDFATGYLRRVLSVLGLDPVHVASANTAVDKHASLAAAHAAIDAVALPP